jgi:peptidoglycan/xylan/chitin deacetylase (PgdA/CDA1 family)
MHRRPVEVRPLHPYAPAARVTRLAGAVREWTSATGTAPVTGSHRRPGTLPIESWLLIGRHKQQGLLAALVAVGIIMIMIPTQQRTSDVEAVSAAQRQAAAAAAAASRDPARPAVTTPGRRTKPAQRETPPAGPDARATAVPAPPTQPAPVEPSTPAGPAPPTASPDPGPPDASVSRRGTGPGFSVRRSGSGAVALSFDDGPDPVQTPKMLDLLDKYDVKATFCLVGARARAHPDLVRRIVTDGHALCNHSWDHSFTLGKADPEKIRADLEATDQAIRAAVPEADIPYFRAPGGNFTERLVTVADALGMTSLYWEVDPRDWDQPEGETDAAHVERVVTEVERLVRPGSIVLSHDFEQPNTVDAYAILLPWLTERFELGFPHR